MVRILWIEGKRAEGPSFIPSLRKKGYAVEVVATGAEAQERLFHIDPDLVVVDAASMRTSGKRICRALRERLSNLPILVIIQANQNGPDESCANAVLIQPFTIRKLLNRINPFLPGNSANLLHVGVIRLDLERKQVRCQGRESRLTPRLAQLLQILMQHPGEVIERETLFRQVWNTEYTADTRTLDVHISWLRHAIENEPRNPEFLKTIRGVGYRLDI